jgi:hypothetical protein
MLTIYHLKTLTKDERNALNDPETGGWDSSERFSRYADITTGFNAKLLPQVAIALLKGEYEAVARVDSDDLEDGFRFTNTINQSWSNFPTDNVTPLRINCRSTSVGDIITRGGSTYVVAPVGFKLLTAATE